MRKIFCDCCKREIRNVEHIYSIEIKKGQDNEIILEEICSDCYDSVKRVLTNARLYRDLRGK